MEELSFEAPVKNAPVLDSNPFLLFNPNLCIACQRCVGACNTAAGNHTLRTGKRGVRTTIQAPFGPNWKATQCESCGNCAQACPRARSRKSAVAIIASGKSRACAPRVRIAALAASSTLL